MPIARNDTDADQGQNKTRQLLCSCRVHGERKQVLPDHRRNKYEAALPGMRKHPPSHAGRLFFLYTMRLEPVLKRNIPPNRSYNQLEMRILTGLRSLDKILL